MKTLDLRQARLVRAARAPEYKAAGIKAGTANRDIAIIRRALNLAAKAWRAAHGSTRPPCSPCEGGEKRKPRPATQEEQAQLFKELPGYLA
jgi:hypothetical protein